MSDMFSNSELVAGSIIGFRDFYQERDCPLISASFYHAWTPGENVAQCGGDRETVKVLGPQHRREDGWDAGVALGCTCGFYAYHAGGFLSAWHNYWNNVCDCPVCTGAKEGIRHPVNGLIEGYGRVIVGSRGFRAAKARILCFMINDDPDPGTVPRVPSQETRYRYPNVPVLPWGEALERWPLSLPPGERAA